MRNCTWTNLKQTHLCFKWFTITCYSTKGRIRIVTCAFTSAYPMTTCFGTARPGTPVGPLSINYVIKVEHS